MSREPEARAAGLDVRRASAAEVRALQQAVLRPDGPLPGDRAAPPGWIHVAARLGRDVVGATSIGPATWPCPELVRLAPPIWQLRSMAVRSDLRRRGIGHAVLMAAVALARDEGAGSMWAQARLAAVPFYEQAGWRAVGPQWLKPAVGPHRYVVRPLPG